MSKGKNLQRIRLQFFSRASTDKIEFLKTFEKQKTRFCQLLLKENAQNA